MTGLLPDDGPGSVITVGTFDGVQPGPPPGETATPPAAPPLLTLAHERREVLAQSELDAVVFMRFTRELSHLSAEQFVRLLMRRYHLREQIGRASCRERV